MAQQTKIINAFLGLLSNYSQSDEEILGVDMSPGFIRVARLEFNDEKWTVLNLIERSIDTDPSLPLIDQSNIYTDTLKDIVKKEKIKTKNVAISIPVSNAIIKVIEMPSMTDNEIKSAIEYESLWENIVSISEDLSQYAIFHQVIKRHIDTNTMDLLFVASKASDISTYNKIIKNAGLETIIIDVKCFATRNSFDIGAQDNEQTLTEATAIVEFGSFENYLLIVKEGAPHITDIFVKDSDTKDLERGSFNDNELEEFFNRYSMQVKQILSAYETKYLSGRIKTLYVISDIDNIRNYLEMLANSLTDLNIVFYDPFSYLSISGKEKDLANEHKNRSVFTAAIGLATRSLDIFGYYKYTTGVKNINLLPDRSKIKKKKQANVLLRLLIIAILLISIGIGTIQYLILSNEKSTLLKQVDPYEQLKSELSEKKSKLAKNFAEKKRLNANLRFGEKITTNQMQLRDFFNDMGSSIPKSTWLNTVKYKSDNSVEIVGYAINDESILNYITNLSKSREVEDVALKTMELKTFDNETVRERYEVKAFKLVAHLKPPRKKDKDNFNIKGSKQ
jgi:type IV pilus assembly protein PilN